MSFLPDRIPNIVYQLFDKHANLVDWFASKKEAHAFAEAKKYKKYTVIGVCPEFHSIAEQTEPAALARRKAAASQSN